MGFKYNPLNGGPADTYVTRWIENRANGLLRGGNAGVKRVGYERRSMPRPRIRKTSFCPYVRDLGNVVDMDAIREAGLTLGVDPLGGAAVPYWEPINSIYHLDITVVNPTVDPTFSFMTVDHDGKIRMDCSSPYAMARPVGLKDQYQVAFANDPDSDRHGIVTPSAGLMNPNHYLAVAIGYLLTHRPNGRRRGVGKTLVQQQHDRQGRDKARTEALRVPVGFKWFAPASSTVRAASAVKRAPEPASCGSTARSGPPTRTARSWTCSRPRSPPEPARIQASTTVNDGELAHLYTRIDAPATPEQKERLGNSRQMLSRNRASPATRSLPGSPARPGITRLSGGSK